jgi:RNA polymerase sigma-70 factor (ECF subfamily)
MMGVSSLLLAKDEALALRAQAGATVDFDALVDRYAARIHAFCMRATGSAADAEDLTQATFLAAFECLGNYNPERPFGPWLFGIAANQCRMWHRRQGRMGERVGRILDTVRDPAPTPERAYEHAETARVIRRVLAGLPSTYRGAVSLRCLQGMSTREIAEALDISVEAAAKRLARGMNMLRDRLQARGLPLPE